MTISKLNNANVYLDGGDYLGKAEEVVLPEITVKMTEHETLGLFGRMELPDGLEKMGASITWNALYPEVLKKAGNPFKAVSIQVRASQKNYDNAGLNSETPVVVMMTGVVNKTPLGTFKQNEAVKCQTTMSVHYVKLKIGGKDIIEIDVASNIYKVNGVDVLFSMKINQ